MIASYKFSDLSNLLNHWAELIGKCHHQSKYLLCNLAEFEYCDLLWKAHNSYITERLRWVNIFIHLNLTGFRCVDIWGSAVLNSELLIFFLFSIWKYMSIYMCIYIYIYIYIYYICLMVRKKRLNIRLSHTKDSKNSTWCRLT